MFPVLLPRVLLHTPHTRTREPRGLGFIEFFDERDAEEAVRGMDRMMLGGREVRHAVVQLGLYI